MANPRDEAPGEDLFDDLDKFFAPIDETEWPEPEPAPRARAPREAPTPEPVAEGGDLFPTGWDDLEPEAEEGLLEAAASPAPDDTSTYELPVADAPSGPAGPAADWPSEGFGGEGEEEESIVLNEAPETPPPAAPARRSRGRDTREPAELSIDDLKVAPPEYSQLPGPPDEEDTGIGSLFADDADEEPSFATAPAAPTDEPTPSLDASPPPPRPVEPPRERAPAESAPPRRSVEDDLLAGLEARPDAGPRTVRVGLEEPLVGTGPAWEDPTSQAVSAETVAAPRGGRNLSAALISGVGLGALALILLAIGAAPFAYLAAVVLLAAQAELYAVARGRGYQPATALGLVIGGLVVYAGYNKGEAAMAAMLVLGTMLTYLWYMAAPVKARKGTLANAALTVLGIVYIPFFAGFIFQILPVPGGRAVVLWIIALTVIYDVAAFGIGSLWGHRPIAPSISPNKSWEGAIGASVLTFFASIAFGPQIAPFANDFLSTVGLGLVVVVMAPLGDLAESALKRDLGVKDMSTILPGHGGLMDRIDSLLFVLPAAYLFLQIAFS